MKIKQLQEYLQKKRAASAVFFNLTMQPDPNFYYLTGYDGYGVLAVPQSGKAVLIAPLMEGERARKAVQGSKAGVKVLVTKKRLFEELKRHVRGNTIGIDKTSMNMMLFSVLKKNLKRKKIVDVSKEMLRLRSVKTAQETANVRKACAISDAILKKCFDSWKQFKTEKDVAMFLEVETIKAGCVLSFPAIVASGSNASQPHYMPKNVKLKKGFCVIDFGVKYLGYCSDTTRTVYIGTPSAAEKKMYQLLFDAQKAGIDSSKNGVSCGDVVNAVNAQLGDYTKYFIHGLGHGVGVEIHEYPNLKPDSKDILVKGMTFTIEPGVYIPGKFGMRIEDTVLMDKKAVVLTKIPKALLIR